MLKLLIKLLGIKIKPKHAFKINPKFERGKIKKNVNFAYKNLYVKRSIKQNKYIPKNLPSENNTF